MTLKLWGRTSSLNVRKALLALHETGTPFERIDAGMAFGIVGTPAYRAKNPNALVPLLEHGAFALWESNAIVRYLCARYAPALYPAELEARFDAERWMDWQQTTLNRAGGPAFLQLVRTAPEARDPETIARSIAATDALWDLLDAQLAASPYFAGDSYTMADIPIACEMHRWRALPIAQVPRPHLDAWYDRVLARPSAAGVLDLPLS